MFLVFENVRQIRIRQHKSGAFFFFFFSDGNRKIKKLRYFKPQMILESFSVINGKSLRTDINVLVNSSLFPYMLARLTIYNSGPVALWLIFSAKIKYIMMYSIGTLFFYFALTFNRTCVPFELKILHQPAVCR